MQHQRLFDSDDLSGKRELGDEHTIRSDVWPDEWGLLEYLPPYDAEYGNARMFDQHEVAKSQGRIVAVGLHRGRRIVLLPPQNDVEIPNRIVATPKSATFSNNMRPACFIGGR